MCLIRTVTTIMRPFGQKYFIILEEIVCLFHILNSVYNIVYMFVYHGKTNQLPFMRFTYVCQISHLLTPHTYTHIKKIKGKNKRLNTYSYIQEIVQYNIKTNFKYGPIYFYYYRPDGNGFWHSFEAFIGPYRM